MRSIAVLGSGSESIRILPAERRGHAFRDSVMRLHPMRSPVVTHPVQKASHAAGCSVNGVAAKVATAFHVLARKPVR